MDTEHEHYKTSQMSTGYSKQKAKCKDRLNTYGDEACITNRNITRVETVACKMPCNLLGKKKHHSVVLMCCRPSERFPAQSRALLHVTLVPRPLMQLAPARLILPHATYS